MKSIEELIRQIEKLPDCLIFPKLGIPDIKPYILPNDLLKFYGRCGGASLFRSSPYSIEIVSPSRLVLANPVITGIGRDDLTLTDNDRADISWSWYIVGEGPNAQFITIDLASERLGKCFDSFWDCHAVPNHSPIIARSFTELLLNLIENQGQHWYWLQPGFQSYGDAYDFK